MARLLTEGFESGDILFWTSTTAGAIATSIMRTGAYSFGTGVNGVAVKMLGANYSELYFRYAVYLGATQQNLYWRNTSTVLGYVKTNSLRKIEIYINSTLVATGTRVLNPTTWYVFEIYAKIADSGGVVTVKVDGIQDVTYTGDTKPGTVDINEFAFSSDASWAWMDDFALNDTSGAVDNSWCGDGRVIALTPNGNGDLSQLTNQLGTSTNNYSYVDEKPSNGDADYVQGSTVDQKDLYTLTDCGLTAVSISRVWAESRSRDTVAAGGLLALTIKTNSTEYSSADIALLNTYSRVIGSDYPLNPNTGVAWTIAQVDALQAGPKTRS